MTKPHMSNPRARREVRHRHAIVERQERQAARRERHHADARFGWHDDGDQCIGPACLNPAHFEP